MMPRYYLTCVLLPLFVGFDSDQAQAKISLKPLPTIILRNSARFLAFDSENSVTLYRLKDGQLLRTFSGKQRIATFAVTPDEACLLLVWTDGSLALWSIDGIQQLWSKNPSQTGLTTSLRPTFAQNGQSFIVPNLFNPAIIFDSLTGKPIGKIGLTNSPVQAALSSDGSKGVFRDWNHHIFTFDTSTGITQDTGLIGSGPIEYSADGKYFMCETSQRSLDERLQIVAVENLAKKEVGRFAGIMSFRPMADGSFHISAMVEEDCNGKKCHFAVGLDYVPRTGELKTAWRFPCANREEKKRMNCLLDPNDGTMFAVWTNYQFVTRVEDLKTGRILFTLDNSLNYQSPYLKRTVKGAAQLRQRTQGGKLLTYLVWGFSSSEVFWV